MSEYYAKSVVSFFEDPYFQLMESDEVQVEGYTYRKHYPVKTEKN